MLLIYGFISCGSRTLEVTHEVHLEQEPEDVNEEILPCSISLVPHLNESQAFVEILVSGVDTLKMELSLYGGREKLVRTLDVQASTSYELEMFWPMETPNHSWQDTYGTEVQLLVQGGSNQGTSCSEQYVDVFTPTHERLYMYNLISDIQWDRANVEIQGLLVSTPPLHEPEKFALVSTPISQTILRVLGPFTQEDGFADIGNLALYETQQGKLLSMVAQEGWPGFEEQLFVRHNVMTGVEEALLSFKSSVHHTTSIQEREDGTLDLLTSIWSERREVHNSRGGYISFPVKLHLEASDVQLTPLVDIDKIYPNSQNAPLTYNNFVWPAEPTGTMVGAVTFTNNAISLPTTSENSSSLWLYDTQTQKSWWFSNSGHQENVYLEPESVIALEAMPDEELGLIFPHAVQLDGTRLYVQDHMDVDANGVPPRINAFNLDGSLLWSYAIPDVPSLSENARRRHGGLWLINLDGDSGVCGFFVDIEGTYCVDQDGNPVGALRKEELSVHQGDKWQLVVYLENWQNTYSALE